MAAILHSLLHPLHYYLHYRLPMNLAPIGSQDCLPDLHCCYHPSRFLHDLVHPHWTHHFAKLDRSMVATLRCCHFPSPSVRCCLCLGWCLPLGLYRCSNRKSCSSDPMPADFPIQLRYFLAPCSEFPSLTHHSLVRYYFCCSDLLRVNRPFLDVHLRQDSI